MFNRNPLTQLGTDGRTYGGDPGLVHIPDHHRKMVGALMADKLDHFMRERSEQVPPVGPEAPLCPGCYMIAALDMLVYLAKWNGQDMREMGATMAEACNRIAAEGEDYDTQLIEEIHVIPARDVAAVMLAEEEARTA